MSENKLNPKRNDRDVVFRNSLGEFLRVSIDSRTSMEKLIKERETLGETVVIITDPQEAENLMRSFEAFSRLNETDSQITAKRW